MEEGKVPVEVATGYPLKLGQQYQWDEHVEYLGKNFGSWEYSWRLVLPVPRVQSDRCYIWVPRMQSERY